MPWAGGCDDGDVAAADDDGDGDDDGIFVEDDSTGDNVRWLALLKSLLVPTAVGKT